MTACSQPRIGSSAYTAEAIALAVRISRRLPPPQPINPIFSDCRAAIATVTAAITPFSNKCAAQRMHIITDSIYKSGPVTINRTRGHPERRKPVSVEWNYQEWGIHIADVAACADSAALQCLNVTSSQTLVHSMPLPLALQSIIPPQHLA